MEKTSNSWLTGLLQNFLKLFFRRKVWYYHNVSESPEGDKVPIPPKPPRYICYLTHEKNLPGDFSTITLIVVGTKVEIDQLIKDRTIKLIYAGSVKK